MFFLWEGTYTEFLSIYGMCCVSLEHKHVPLPLGWTLIVWGLVPFIPAFYSYQQTGRGCATYQLIGKRERTIMLLMTWPSVADHGSDAFDDSLSGCHNSN